MTSFAFVPRMARKGAHRAGVVRKGARRAAGYAPSRRGVLYGSGSQYPDVAAIEQRVESAWVAFNANRTSQTAFAAREELFAAQNDARALNEAAQAALSQAQAYARDVSDLLSTLVDLSDYEAEFQSVAADDSYDDTYDDGGY